MALIDSGYIHEDDALIKAFGPRFSDLFFLFFFFYALLRVARGRKKSQAGTVGEMRRNESRRMRADVPRHPPAVI